MIGKLPYPKTRTVDVSDDFFGTRVADPYRWLEDAADPEVQAWTQEQMDLAQEILGTMPGRNLFQQRLTEAWDYPKYSTPVEKGGRLFYTVNDGLQNQSLLYVKDPDSEARLLLDPNTWSADGTVALADFRPTNDGKILMYATAESGVDWRTFKFLDVDTGDHLDDVLENIKFSSAEWLPDASGFYYTRFPEDSADEGEGNQQVHQQLYFHRMGSPQSADAMLYERPDLSNSTIWSEVSHDGRYLVLHISTASAATENRLYYSEIGGDGSFVPLFDDEDAAYYFTGNNGTTFYILTTHSAPNLRLIAVDLERPGHWREIIPAGEDAIAACQIINQQFVVAYLHHARHIIRRFSKNGDLLGDIPLPDLGAMGNFATLSGGPDDTEMFFPFTSYLSPLRVLHYDFTTDSVTTHFDAQVETFDASGYETTQIFYESKDGTRVPMFITARKDIALDGTNPTILYAYGGYNISQTPSYRAWLPVWLEQGGIYAVANIRGGPSGSKYYSNIELILAIIFI
jgi:prolyl oligopeptidase